MSDILTTWGDFLHDMLPAVRETYTPGVLFEMLERDAAERKRKDDEWLATLTPRELRVELMRRRIVDVENRSKRDTPRSSRSPQRDPAARPPRGTPPGAGTEVGGDRCRSRRCQNQPVASAYEADRRRARGQGV